MLCTHAIVFVTERAKRAYLDCARNVINGSFEQYDTELGAFYSRSLVQYALRWPSFYQDFIHSWTAHMWSMTKVTIGPGGITDLSIPLG